MAADGGGNIANIIRHLFEEVERNDMDLSRVVGASDEEIDRMAAAQNVPNVPVAFREVLRLIGKNEGPFFGAIDYFGVSGDYYEAKDLALEFYRELPPDQDVLVDADHMLVLTTYQGEACVVIDGASLGESNPQILTLLEGGEIIVRGRTVVDWFAEACERVAGCR
ncbi:hypothetical protein NDR87_27665 [Nocardia sp. CDC159]|uniref:SMI1/KNR4 family protein n=1 Tax=Nocardia pulmonis TaxID=2951408 RepID=A0A9X2ED77_9NOCA|nr:MULTISPECIES: hypothetical protein [Nocardia]MCM6777270.1 hypothetical protein [Nocardia pulmonis]MCM6790155.1 hypothetical protein [Nocardia sp. CDC159]